MNLGAFSVSLAVKDIHASSDFYEKLGFTSFHGDITQNWLIMKNGDTIIGLFQGMFENNLLTFNPGWDQNAQETETYEDVRTIQSKLLEAGIKLVKDVGDAPSGPVHLILQDPDGNTILIDQHR